MKRGEANIERVQRFLIKQWFLISLAVVLAVGFFGSSSVAGVRDSVWLRNGLLFGVLFVMAFPVATEDLGRALRSPWAALYASAINFGVIPLVAWAGSIGFEPFLGEGILIAAVVPCTLASAAVWTRRAGGNDSVAIFVTLLTNGLCFLLTPFWIRLTTGDSASISTSELIGKLALLVVLPMTMAQILRQFRPVGRWASRRKVSLSVFAQVGILTMVLIGAAKMGQKVAEGSVSITFGELFRLIIVVNLVHLAALYGGYFSAAWLGFERKNQIAIGIAGSQKTLMVGLNTAVELQCSILPMLLYHVCQLLVDTLVADSWKKRDASPTVPTTGSKAVASAENGSGSNDTDPVGE